MSVGYLLKVGDKTTCGGVIVNGDLCFNIGGMPAATEGSKVSCGKNTGLFKIIGGVGFMNTPTGKAAGTLDSISSCPCRSKFIESSSNQKYIKETIDHQVYSNKYQCECYDGAIDVAAYIVKEIKLNIESEEVKLIQGYMDKNGELLKLWNQMTALGKAVVPYPTPNTVPAMAIWSERVFRNRPWDHKPLIRDKFRDVAVTRNTPSGNKSVSHYHKYLNYDYFYDIWSNIHYGYVGLVAGFSREMLLMGASMAQFVDNSTIVGDAPDDVMSIKIGFCLYDEFGESAQGLTAYDILSKLEEHNFNESRLPHSCKDDIK